VAWLRKRDMKEKVGRERNNDRKQHRRPEESGRHLSNDMWRGRRVKMSSRVGILTELSRFELNLHDSVAMLCNVSFNSDNVSHGTFDLIVPDCGQLSR
jgi:hypothetical protein